jgi:hypothetical protein
MKVLQDLSQAVDTKQVTTEKLKDKKIVISFSGFSFSVTSYYISDIQVLCEGRNWSFSENPRSSLEEWIQAVERYLYTCQLLRVVRLYVEEVSGQGWWHVGGLMFTASVRVIQLFLKCRPVA